MPELSMSMSELNLFAVVVMVFVHRTEIRNIIRDVADNKRRIERLEERSK